MRKIKKGDPIIVLSGKDKGKQGVVLSVLGAKDATHENVRVVVEGINMVTRHIKPNPAADNPGGIVRQERAIHISNVALYNAATGRKDRVGFKVLEDGRKVRVFKSTGQVVGA